MIGHLRPSPDGKKLAYQITTGCGFIGAPEVYVLDLTTAKTDYIAHGSGPMHWTSTSDKLYFYRQYLEGPYDDYSVGRGVREIRPSHDAAEGGLTPYPPSFEG